MSSAVGDGYRWPGGGRIRGSHEFRRKPAAAMTGPAERNVMPLLRGSLILPIGVDMVVKSTLRPRLKRMNMLKNVKRAVFPAVSR